MKRVVWAALLWLASVGAAAGTNYPHMANYSDTDGLGKPLLDASGNVVTNAVWMLARGADLITLNATVHSDYRVGKVLPALRAAGSDSLKVLAYDIVNYRWTPMFATPGTQWNREHVALNTMEAAGKPSWIYNNDGSLQFFSVNWGNPEVMDSLITIWNYWANVPEWDGFFFDEYSTDISWNNSTGGGFNYARAGYAFLSSLDSARRVQGPRFENALHAKTGMGNKLMVGNGSTPTAYQSNWNGRLYEGWLSNGLWGTYPQFINTYLTNAKPYDMIRVENFSPLYDSEWCRKGRLGLGITSLGPGWFCQDNGKFSGYSLTIPYMYWIQDEVSVRPWPLCTVDTMGAHKGWLGQPTGAATQIATNVWRRNFEKGCVIVNVSGASYTANVTGYGRIRGFRDATTNNGLTTTTADIPTNDALFLVKVRRASRRPWMWWKH